MHDEATAAAPRRILLASLDNLGDLIFASALVPPLRHAFPTSRLVLWCKAYAADVAAFVPGVDHVIATDPFWDRSPGRAKGRLRTFVQGWRAVRADACDVAIVTSRHWRVAAAVALAGIPRRIGYDRRHTRRWLTTCVADANRDLPVLVELARLLEPLGLRAGDLHYALDVSGRRDQQRAMRVRLGPSPVVALHPFASRRDRCVDLAVWAQVAAALDAHGLRPLWVGTASELEALRAVGNLPLSSLHGDQVAGSSLAELVVLLSVATLFIGHDSGPMHLASALGIPSLGIFAPGEPRRTFPQGTARWQVLSSDSPAGIDPEAMIAAAVALHAAGT